MASVFKRTGKKNYYIEWFDHTGSRKTKSSNTSDFQAAERIANKIQADVALRVEGVLDPRIESIAKQSSKPLKQAVQDFEASLRARRRSEKHITGTINKIEAIANAANFDKLASINADGVNRFAWEMQSSKNRNSSRTIESYLTAIKSLTIWAVKNGKLASDPLSTVEKPKADSDRRLVRRYVTHDEWAWIDSAVRSSASRMEIPGIERALLYAFAIQTGLRVDECRTLTRGQLHLTADPPYVLAKASNTKNKKPARQYLQPELANELHQHVSKKLLGAKVFRIPGRIAQVLKADIELARSKWLESIKNPQEKIEADASDFLKLVDSEGEVLDFHALRHTAATWLIQSGADVRTVQNIIRHTDIKLTLQKYGHLFPGAEADAISRLRSAFTKPESNQQTGTGGVQHNVQHSGFFSTLHGAKSCHKSTPANVAEINEKTLDSQGKPRVSVERLRSELNRRWRICNPEPTNENIEGIDGVQHSGFDDALMEIVEGWTALPPGGKSAVLETFRQHSAKRSKIAFNERGAE